jgi:glyoxylase-like metal-dependent hydrolase (beta-lactamase superfamily II)
VKRSDQVAFMPGFRAFVGGTLDPQDQELEIEGLAVGAGRTLEACALREVFEETGVLLGAAEPSAGATPGTPSGSTPAESSAGGALAAARSRLLQGEATFPQLARELGWRFRSGSLTLTGRWITPPFAPSRFEAAYFLARVPQGQEPSVRVGELAEGEWIAPVDALKRWQMGLETFAAPILYTLIGLAHGEDKLAERLAEAPEASAQPVRRIELKWGVVLQPMKTRPLPPATHTNAYLVGEPEMALIDPGSGEPEELEELFELIDMLASDRRRLHLVLLTHHHPDHVAGVEAVRRRYRVPVAGHADVGRFVRLDFTLKEGDWVPLVPGVADWSLRVLHTPGHAPGHLCFLQPRIRSLFCGDHITGGTGTVIIDPPEGDMAAYLSSLRRLLGEPIETLFPAHGSPQGAAKRRIQWLIAHREERGKKVLAALGPEPRTLAELVERAYDDTPRDLWRYAERSLFAHLIQLQAEGRAVRVRESWRVASG